MKSIRVHNCFIPICISLLQHAVFCCHLSICRLSVSLNGFDIYPELLVQSLVSGVDMEDLGVRSCATRFKNSPAEHADFPEELKQYMKVA